MFFGNEMCMWHGVVEDSKGDPLKLNRVRVRVIGVHSEKLEPSDETGEGIPTDALPWAIVGGGTDSANVNGIGENSRLVNGSHVYGFSRDGRQMQNLVIMGTIPGIPQEAPKNEGFNDPDKVYPKSSHLQEPDVNRLARNEKIDETIVKTKKDGVDKNVPTSTGAQWSEPETPYATEYPYNQVRESESGHIIEIDDTPGAERLHEYHKSGTFEEIHPNGTKVTKVKGDNYEIIAGADFVHVVGACNITVGGDCNLKVIGNVTEETPLHTIKGKLHVTQDITTDANVKAAANVEAAAQVQDASGTMQEMRDTYNGHNHIGNLGAPTSSPGSQMT